MKAEMKAKMKTKKHVDMIRLEKTLLIIAAALILAVLLTGLIGLNAIPSASIIWIWIIAGGLVASFGYTFVAFLFIMRVKDLKVNRSVDDLINTYINDYLSAGLRNENVVQRLTCITHVMEELRCTFARSGADDNKFCNPIVNKLYSRLYAIRGHLAEEEVSIMETKVPLFIKALTDPDSTSCFKFVLSRHMLIANIQKEKILKAFEKKGIPAEYTHCSEIEYGHGNSEGLVIFVNTTYPVPTTAFKKLSKKYS